MLARAALLPPVRRRLPPPRVGRAVAAAAVRCSSAAAAAAAPLPRAPPLPPGTSVLILSPVWPEWRSSAAGTLACACACAAMLSLTLAARQACARWRSCAPSHPGAGA
jgi:hypothetical protein